MAPITNHASWRYLLRNPLLFIFLRVKYDRDLSWSTRLKLIDISDNAILVAAIVSALNSSTHASLASSPSSRPLATAPSPTFSRQIVSNRISAAALALTFIHAIVAYRVSYFLPIHLPACQGPVAATLRDLHAANVAGGLVFAVCGRDKAIHLAGFAVTTLSLSLFSILNAMLSGVLLPAAHPPLNESYVATAPGVWSFARYFGCIWGITIPSAVFNESSCELHHRLGDCW
ncbi:hypothetical protein CCMA1212_005145 [Trichoderma ghanense]|uniref:Uncharacterized protein n=1 Tax=Trichoderma ghanense TaxID=65468 RepID=A0ABY2H2T9_9HYPO